jgi:hypothetical protein
MRLLVVHLDSDRVMGQTPAGSAYGSTGSPAACARLEPSDAFMRSIAGTERALDEDHR